MWCLSFVPPKSTTKSTFKTTCKNALEFLSCGEMLYHLDVHRITSVLHEFCARIVLAGGVIQNARGPAREHLVTEACRFVELGTQRSQQRRRDVKVVEDLKQWLPVHDQRVWNAHRRGPYRIYCKQQHHVLNVRRSSRLVPGTSIHYTLWLAKIFNYVKGCSEKCEWFGNRLLRICCKL